MNRFRVYIVRAGSVAGTVLLLMLVAGCGDEAARDVYLVTGKVHFDGKPVETGRITFRQTEGERRAFSGEIKDGNYQVETEAGKMSVAIIASRPTGKMDRSNPDDPPQPVGEMYIPPKYNDQTELVADVSPEETNEITFDLKPK